MVELSTKHLLHHRLCHRKLRAKVFLPEKDLFPLSEYSSQCYFSIFCCITFAKDLSFFHFVAFLHHWTKIDASALVGFAEFCEFVCFQIIIETYETIFVISVITNGDFGCICIFYKSITFCLPQHT